MRKKQQKLIRFLAIVLAVLLAGGAIVSAVVSIANAEALPKNEISMKIEYMENEQALRISQRVVYINETEDHLDRVVFYAPANMFRRKTALMYDAEDLEIAFPYGYVPGGIELKTVRVNDQPAEYGFQGENELFLRVSCDLQPEQKCEFAFDYYVLLTVNSAFMGIGKQDIRLSDFSLIPASYDSNYGEYILNAPLPFTEYIDTGLASWNVEMELPDTAQIASSGIEECVSTQDHIAKWKLAGENIRDYSIVVGKKYKTGSVNTDSGVEIRALTLSGRNEDVLKYARAAVETCEKWFGAFPFKQIDLVETECASGNVNTSACVWISKDVLSGDKAQLQRCIYTAAAQQYFGKTAYAMPVSDAWLSDSVSEYVGYMILEEAEGHDTYLQELNKQVLPSLQLTIPGGLTVTSSAALFTEKEYSIIIRDRGAAVFHELRTSMGKDGLIEGLKLFYERGIDKKVLTEMDLVEALESATGKSWEKFLTDWVFNIGDYVDQGIDWLD